MLNSSHATPHSVVLIKKISIRLLQYFRHPTVLKTIMIMMMITTMEMMMMMIITMGFDDDGVSDDVMKCCDR